MKQRSINFDSNGFTLSGTLHMPEDSDPPVVFGAHGLYSTSQSPKQVALADACVEAGIAYFRFDHRGCGESQGDFYQDTSLPTRCMDMLSAVTAIKKEGLACTKLGLFGSSMGGAVCISVASMLSADAIVVNAAPIKSDKLLEAVEKSDPSASGASTLFKNDLSFDLTATLQDLHHILIFHGEADDVVPVTHGQSIHELSTPPKRLQVFENGDHVLSNPADQKLFVKESVEWFGRYLK